MYKRQSVNTAQGYELDAIAACTIGGVSTTGGAGTVPGALVGVDALAEAVQDVLDGNMTGTVLNDDCLLYTSRCV